MKSDIGDHQEFQTRVKGFIFSCFVLCFKIVRFNFIKIHDTKVKLHWPSQPRLIMQQMSLFNRKHSQNMLICLANRLIQWTFLSTNTKILAAAEKFMK